MYLGSQVQEKASGLELNLSWDRIVRRNSNVRYSNGEVGARRTQYSKFCLPPPTYDLEQIGTSSALVIQPQMGVFEKSHTYISSIKVKVMSKISVKMARPMVCDLIPVTISTKMVFTV